MIDGQYGYLSQAVRIPKSLFLSSPCQIVYLPNPDWATSTVHVDFGTASKTPDGAVCESQAFLAYIDFYDRVQGVTGLNKYTDVAWASLVTAPRTQKEGGPAMPQHVASSPSDDASGSDAGTRGTGARRRSTMSFARPTDRYNFGADRDYQRDDPNGPNVLWVEEKDSTDYIPGPGSAITKPIMASSIIQEFSLIPTDAAPFLDYLVGRLRDDLDPSTEALAGSGSGAARVYAPRMPQECLDILRLNAVSSPDPPDSRDTVTGSAAPRDTCFITQQVVVVWDSCAASADPTTTTTAAATAPITMTQAGRRAEATCARAAATNDPADLHACLLEAELEKTAGGMGQDLEEDFVKVTVTYQPYDGCNREPPQVLGQTLTMVMLMSAGLMALFVIFVLSPTLYRLFIEFPIRAIIYGLRKLFTLRSAHRQLPLQTGLSSHKEPWAWLSCARVPLLAQLVWLRKQLVYTICTVHNPDGQYRSLQVAVWSVVALMITVMAYPPAVDPALDYYIPPLTFRIVKSSGDPLNTVWFFLQLLAFSLYLGYIGYMCLLSNYNTPQNKYYLVQSVLSVFWLLWLNALVLVQIIGVLWFWNNLSNRWPWLPMTVFMLGNLAMADIRMITICLSSRDRNDERRHREYLELLREVARREERAATAKALRRAASKAAAAAGGGSGSPGGGGGGVVVKAAGASDPDSSSNEALPPREQAKALAREAAAAAVSASAVITTGLPASPSGRVRMPPAEPTPFQPSPLSSSQPSGGIGRHGGLGGSLRIQPVLPPGPVAEGTVSGGSPTAGGGGGGGNCSARRVAYLSQEANDAANSFTDGGFDSRSGPGHVAGSSTLTKGNEDYYDVCDSGGGGGVDAGAGAASGRRRRSSGGGSMSSSSVGGGSEAAGGGRWRKVRATMRRVFRPLSEDAAFRFPAWFLASLLVAAYVLIFTYAKAMIWASVIQDCIGDPTECLNQNLSKYVLFAQRLAGRGSQERLHDLVVDAYATRDTVQTAFSTALNTSNTTLLVLDPAVTGLFNASPVNLTSVQADITDSLTARLSLNLSALLLGVLGAEKAALLPADVTASLQAQVATAVQETVSNFTDAVISAAVPAVVSQQTAVLAALNSTLDPVYSAINQTSYYMGVALKVQGQLLTWKDGLHRRFFACSVAGFTLGLLLGMYSLAQTAVSFRRSARRIRRVHLSRRIFAASSWQLEDLDDPPEQVPLPGTGAHNAAAAAATARPLPLPPAGEGGETKAGAGAAEGDAPAAAQAARSRRGKRGTTFAAADMTSMLVDSDSIVARSEHENIAFAVYFIGVLLSTAVIQLYVVGVALTIGMAVVTHPWLWSWCFPRYYMWLVAIIIGLVLNKVILIAFIGGTWLSDGNRIHRPAAWLAFLVIASATNLIIGLLLALFRIVLLLATTIFTLGKLDVTIFTILPVLDLPHRTFLAGLHLHESMSHFEDPIYLPGPRGRAHRRWRKLQVVVRSVPGDELRELLCTPTGRKSGSSSSSSAGPHALVVQVEEDAHRGAR